MNAFQNFWLGLTRTSRAGLVTGVAVILLAFALTAWSLLRVDYQVLFADLKPQDAQAMTTELDRLKIPYRIGGDGASILVDKATVHATRIKLMGKELPLHGAVGLELFNNTDFGMTEFAQKINYQRALQGELTRTIQSLSEVREVRVLLALPEQGLFRQANARAKASVTVTLRQGQALRGEQVLGIQRLVAAAVPGMTMQDVTIVDGHGIALTRPEGQDAEGAGNTARLDLKRDTEHYLSGKVGAILDQAFGPGQALASVDVTLNMDQIRTTTEDVLPVAARGGLQATGVVVKEREVLRDAGMASDARVLETSSGRGGSSQRDTDYAVGRRVEQVVSQPGSVRRIQVVAVVRQLLPPAQEESLKRLIAAAVGASPERGDAVVLHSIGSAAALSADTMAPSTTAAGAPPGDTSPVADSAFQRLAIEPQMLAVLLAILLGVAWMAIGWVRTRQATRSDPRGVAEPQALTEAERAAALQRLQGWMNGDTPPATPARPRTMPTPGTGTRSGA